MIGTRVLRVRRRVLQAPVLRFRNRDDGRMVTLIGVSHVGEAGYFRRIHDLACELEAAGAAVQYEFMRTSSEEEWAAATDEERAARETLNARYREQPEPPLLVAVKQFLRWEYQSDGLALEPSWQNTDISSLDYLRLVGPATLLAVEDANERGMTLLGDGGIARIGGPFAVIFLRLLTLDRFRLITRFVNRAPDDRAHSAVAVGVRNDMALGALPPSGDSVMIWGADHLAGLRAGLEAAGFRRAGRASWLDVGRLPGTWGCARELWAAIREVRAGSPAQNQEPDPAPTGN